MSNSEDRILRWKFATQTKYNFPSQLVPKKHIGASECPFPWAGSLPVPRVIELTSSFDRTCPASELALGACSALSWGQQGVPPHDPAVQHRYLLHSGRRGRESARRCPGPRHSPPWTAGIRFCLPSCHAPSSHRCNWYLLQMWNWSPLKRRGKACDTHQARRAIISSFLCPETHLGIADQPDRTGRVIFLAASPPGPWQDSTDLWERVPPESPNTSTILPYSCLIPLCYQLQETPLFCSCRCPHTCSDVHISTYLYAHFKKHLS